MENSGTDVAGFSRTSKTSLNTTCALLVVSFGLELKVNRSD